MTSETLLQNLFECIGFVHTVLEKTADVRAELTQRRKCRRHRFGEASFSKAAKGLERVGDVPYLDEQEESFQTPWRSVSGSLCVALRRITHIPTLVPKARSKRSCTWQLLPRDFCNMPMNSSDTMPLKPPPSRPMTLSPAVGGLRRTKRSALLPQQKQLVNS